MRNGLIHKGRVKCGCYLDNKIKETVQIDKGVLIFNPEIILKGLEKWLKDYYQKIVNDEETYKKVREYIKSNILDEDLEAIEKRYNGTMFPC